MRVITTREGRPFVLNVEMNAGGIGDALLGLCATSGLKFKFPSIPIAYNCLHHDWVKLWTGYDSLQPNGNNRAIAMNRGYDNEILSKGQTHRVDRYCNNLGGCVPVAPVLRSPDYVQSLASEYAGCIALCPISVYQNRNWNIRDWHAVQKQLSKDYRVVVVHNNPHALMGFECEKIVNKQPDFVTSVLLNASVVAGVDTGLMHCANLLGRPCVVLSGPSVPSRIYFNPVVTVASEMKCTGCWWQPWHNGVKAFDQSCDQQCGSLWSIRVEQVVQAIHREADIHESAGCA